MFTRKITIEKNSLLIAYKLLHDLLLLMLVSFAGFLVIEGLLPGLLTSKISFSKIVIGIIIILASIVYLGKNFNITYQQAKIHTSKMLSGLVLFSFLLIGNSMLKFNFWENLVITLATLLILFLFYELIFSSKNK
ncbi:MAG: hypothetical protein US25_C0074G0003 [Candidatus Moranbacteria bacterium GW2011_GWE1_36_7]|nr:MAG: hypothetical protein UR99_C0019G0009 [Candidatus Moranbacteria bacterium GW2011_GWD2_36_12]KKQ06176.1 MAG: hypothetical protein US16_C0022G0009 [Candidatus Moranbacteria bacterium GW2011_GWE2_36_40]KKQ11740.1 MAG: hypothetical protein US25_C0074G0003 [Candidatus Moranbacteria bacterium GW2011_GWE1_36_7]